MKTSREGQTVNHPPTADKSPQLFRCCHSWMMSLSDVSGSVESCLRFGKGQGPWPSVSSFWFSHTSLHQKFISSRLGYICCPMCAYISLPTTLLHVPPPSQAGLQGLHTSPSHIHAHIHTPPHLSQKVCRQGRTLGHR